MNNNLHDCVLMLLHILNNHIIILVCKYDRLDNIMANKTNKELNIQIGQMLQTARENRRITQDEVARTIGMSKQHLSAVERGVNKASVEMLLGYCKALSKSFRDCCKEIASTFFRKAKLSSFFRLVSIALVSAIRNKWLKIASHTIRYFVPYG